MSRVTPALALILFLTAAVGCGGLRALPSQGGPRWLALESEHFLLYTDRDERGARAVSAQLERRIADLVQLGFPAQAPLALELQVILLDDRAELERFVGSEHVSLFVQQLPFEPLLLASRDTWAESLRTLTHELAHFLADRGFGWQPSWLSEGLACYFESAYEEPSGGFVTGAVPQQYLRWLHTHPRMAAGQLLNFSGPASGLDLSASAWLLVHYLMSERSAEFAAFRSALAQGKSAADSWAETLSDLSPERLDGLLDGYLRAGSFLTHSRQAVASAGAGGAAALRTLSDADVYALRGQLYASCDTCGDDTRRAALASLTEALRLDPTHVSASALLASTSAQPAAAALAQARALVRAHPEAWLSWLLLARAQTQTDSAAHGCDAEVTSQLRTLAPQQPFALMHAALCELAAGRTATALDLSAGALHLSPTSPGVLLLRATVLRALGRCDELSEVLTRVQSAPHTRVAPEQLRQLADCHPDAQATAAVRCSEQNNACGGGTSVP